MIEDLPSPVAAYAAANARLDLDAMLAAFAEDATVHDDGGRHGGREAIRAWIQKATIDNRAVFIPERWRDDDGAIVVEGQAHGDFPGSPIRFDFRFTLAGDRIRQLVIV